MAIGRFIKKLVRESTTASEAINKIEEVVPAKELKGNKGKIARGIRDEFKKEGPKEQTKKSTTAKLNRRASEAQARETDTPRTQALTALGDAMRSSKKKDFDPTKTKSEAGASAARVSGAFRSKQQKGMQGAYNRLKAEVMWMEKNEPGSSYIAGRKAEMRRLSKRGKIDTGQSVEPKKPAGLFNKGGAAKKKNKVPVVTIGIGMMPTPKGKKTRTGSKDFRNGGMVMSSTNNLKPVPSGNKGKGLRALPKPVRNNMGFMNKGGMVKK